MMRLSVSLPMSQLEARIWSLESPIPIADIDTSLGAGPPPGQGQVSADVTDVFSHGANPAGGFVHLVIEYPV